MNAVQKRYIKAKAAYELATKQERQFELDFMAKKNIMDDDGNPARRVYEIDNDELFDKVNAEYSAAVNESGARDRYLKARDEFKDAERELLEFAFSVISKSMNDTRETLKHGAETNLKIREKIIDAVLRLDTK